MLNLFSHHLFQMHQLPYFSLKRPSTPLPAGLCIGCFLSLSQNILTQLTVWHTPSLPLDVYSHHLISEPFSDHLLKNGKPSSHLQLSCPLILLYFVQLHFCPYLTEHKYPCSVCFTLLEPMRALMVLCTAVSPA